MRIAYLDCFAGISGDMMLGALVDLGADLAQIDAAVRGLGLDGFELTAERTERCHLGATKVTVAVTAKQPHRHLHHIEAILAKGSLSESVRARAGRVFRALCEAEARVHRVPIEKVHLHEVGAVDAIVDVVGACIGLEALAIERLVCSPVVVGRGMTRGEHGAIPVPGPATLELLAGKPVRPGPVEAEMTTPTGAAIVATLSDSFGAMPDFTITKTGYGAGTRAFEELPNLLRIIIGDDAPAPASDVAVVLEANLDDVTPQVLAYASQAILRAGALDVWVTPATMKKGRPGFVLSALVSPSAVTAITSVMMRETTTIGVRRHAVERSILTRRHETVATPWGPVRMKLAGADGVHNALPEFDDCAATASAHGVPLKDVQAAAVAAWLHRGH